MTTTTYTQLEILTGKREALLGKKTYIIQGIKESTQMFNDYIQGDIKVGFDMQFEINHHISGLQDAYYELEKTEKEIQVLTCKITIESNQLREALQEDLAEFLK